MATPYLTTGIAMTGIYQSYLSSNYMIKCFMEIENNTGLELRHRNSLLYHGEFGTPPWHIKPQGKGQFCAHKTSLSMYGSTGMATWYIGNTDDLLAIMWDVPLKGVRTPNVLTLGIVDKTFVIPGLFEDDDYTTLNDSECYDTILKIPENEFRRRLEANYDFRSRGYYDDITPVQVSSRRFILEGTMGSSDESTIKIVLRKRR